MRDNVTTTEKEVNYGQAINLNALYAVIVISQKETVARPTLKHVESV
jgi:hypothetical protein